MRRILFLLSLLLLPFTSAAQGFNGGILYASDFDNWNLPQGTGPAMGSIAWQDQNICKVGSSGYNFVAPKVGRPLLIVDVNPNMSETVVPTTVIVGPQGCSLTASMAHPHYTYTVRSGTKGLQEAIDYNAGTWYGALVFFTRQWTQIGGTNAMLPGLTGNASVWLVDERTNCPVPYTWGGSTYVAGADWCGGGGSGPVLQTNTVNNSSQALLNFVDSSTVKFTNPSGGIETATCATSTVGGIGCVKPDGTSITIDVDGTIHAVTSSGLAVQTNGVNNSLQTVLNHVDTATIKWTNPSGGVELANCLTATLSLLGCVKPDGTTITISGGTISAAVVNLQHNDSSTGINQTVLDFNDTNPAADPGYQNVRFLTDSTGRLAGEVQIVQNPAATSITIPSGNYIPIYPHRFTITREDYPPPSLVGAADGQNASGTVTMGNICSLSYTDIGTWDQYNLADVGLTPADVIDVQGFAVAGIAGIDKNAFCFPTLAPPVFASTLLDTGSANLALPQGQPNPNQQTGPLPTGYTGAQVATATTVVQMSISGQTRLNTQYNISSAGLLIHYAGPHIPVPGRLYFRPPLGFDLLTQSVFLDPSFPQSLNSWPVGTAPDPNLSYGQGIIITGTTDCVTPSGNPEDYSWCYPHPVSGSVHAWGPFPGGSGGGDTITSPGGTLTVGGTSTNTTLDLALGHSNTWTVNQNFGLGLTIASGHSLTNTGVVDGCATWATGILGSTTVPCGSGGGGFPTGTTGGAAYYTGSVGAISSDVLLDQSSIPFQIAAGSLATQDTMTHSGHAPAGLAGSVVLAPDAAGLFDVNENNTGFSRVCTAANAATNTGCQTGGGSSTLYWQRQLAHVVDPTTIEPSPQIQEHSAVWGAPEYAGFSSYSQVVKHEFTSGWGSTAFGGQGVQICFGESPDGLTQPVRIGTCISNHDRGTLEKFGSTYVVWAKNESTGGIDVYSGSTIAGLTLTHSNVIACGSNGNETANSIGRVMVWSTNNAGAAFNMLYACEDSSTLSYGTWLATAATSTASSWTKSSTLPVLGDGSAGSSASCYNTTGNYVNVQSATALTAWLGCGPAGLTPTPYIYRATSTNNGASWTLDAAPSLQEQVADEGLDLASSQIGDPWLLDGGTLTRTVLYYQAYQDGCAGSVTCGSPAYVKAAIIPQPIATVATSIAADGGNLGNALNMQVNEVPSQKFLNRINLIGANGVNIIDLQNGNYQITAGSAASDNFNRAAGALGANWTGSANLTIASPGLVGNASGANTADFDWYTPIGTFVNGCSYITIGAAPTSSSGSWTAATVRQTGTGDTYAVLAYNNPSNTVTVRLYKFVSGTPTALDAGTATAGKSTVGDVYGICAQGTTISSWRGDVTGKLTQANSLTDSSITGAGYPGMGIPSNSTGGEISFWNGYSTTPSIAPHRANRRCDCNRTGGRNSNSRQYRSDTGNLQQREYHRRCEGTSDRRLQTEQVGAE